VGRGTQTIIAAAILVLLVGGAALLVGRLRASAPDTTVALALKDGQHEVALDQALVFTTSRAVDVKTFRAGLAISPPQDGVIAADKSGRKLTWRPTLPWRDTTDYTVTIKSVEDPAHRRFASRRWRFTTTLVPRVIGLTAADGTLVPDRAEIASGAQVIVRFNTPMDSAAVPLAANGQAAGLSWAADRRSATVDGGALKIGPVNLAVAGGKDVAGRPLAAAWSQQVSIVYHVDVHKVPLKAPALIQVPNDPAARPQSGLQSANTIFEYDTEGNITRFTCLFTNVPDTIGNIRSGRLISFPLTRHYQGMLFASGFSAGTAGRLNADPVPFQYDASPSIFYRVSSRPAPHNLYLAGSAVQTAIGRSSLAPAGPPRWTAAFAGGDPGDTVQVPEHRSVYHYDPFTSTYTKDEDGTTMQDAAIGQPLRIRMVVVLHATATLTDYSEDVNGSPGLDWDMESGGHADFYVEGRHASGRWSSVGRNTPYHFALDDGTPLALSNYLTWVDVVRG
jgi:hypothetical protein